MPNLSEFRRVAERRRANNEAPVKIRPAKSLTLVMVDTVSVMRGLPAFTRALGVMEFERALFFHRPSDGGFEIPGVEFVGLPDVVSKETENRWHVVHLHSWISTAFAFVVEWDSFVVNPAAWSDEFLNYDYVGAPWDRPKGGVVGNSGLHLRSTAFCEATYALRHLYQGVFYPHDIKECEELRPAFEAEGLKFAPPRIGAVFAYERNRRYSAYQGSFGVHGVKEWRDYVR